MRELRAVVCVCVTLNGLPAVLSAQQNTSMMSLRDLLGESMTLSVMPSYGWVSPGGRSAFETRASWPGRPDGRYALAAGVELGGVRFGLKSYVRSALDAQLLRRAMITTWLGVAGSVGNGSGPRQMFQLGAGMQTGPLGLGVRTSWLEFVDTLSATDGSGRFPIVQRTYTDAEATATQRLGPLRLAVTAGNRFGTVSTTRSWAYATLTVPVRDHIGLSLASGWRPDQPERAQPHGAFAQISLRFDVRTNSERSAVVKTPVEEELSLTAVPLDLGYRLRIRATAARSVALKGDITNWDVKELHKAGDGHWELEIEAKPGVYLINIRIDDQLWTVPAGLVAVSDSFGGLAGVLNLQ